MPAGIHALPAGGNPTCAVVGAVQVGAHREAAPPTNGAPTHALPHEEVSESTSNSGTPTNGAPTHALPHGGRALPAASLRLERRLAVGRMTEIWLGSGAAAGQRSGTPGRLVAIKLLKPDWLARPGARALLRREYELLAGLRHPNIVAAEAFIDAPDRVALVCEHLGGGDLVSLAGAPARHWIAAARDVLGALAYLHDRGFAHRDLKARNVMFDSEGRARLIDFGSAARIGAPWTHHGTTAAHRPARPRSARVAAEQDLYAFAVLLHELLTGRLPHPAESGAGVMVRARVMPGAGVGCDARNGCRAEDMPGAETASDAEDMPGARGHGRLDGRVHHEAASDVEDMPGAGHKPGAETEPDGGVGPDTGAGPGGGREWRRRHGLRAGVGPDAGAGPDGGAGPGARSWAHASRPASEGRDSPELAALGHLLLGTLAAAGGSGTASVSQFSNVIESVFANESRQP